VDTTKANNLLLKIEVNNVEKHIESIQYHHAYNALLKLAARTSDDTNDEGILALSCAVYGWMPTILKNYEFSRIKTSKPISDIKLISRKSDAEIFLNQNMEEIGPLNNSWIGTSKLLHVLNPEFFPIWDIRVAKKFGFDHHYQIKNRKIYLEYFNFIHKKLEEDLENIYKVRDFIKNKYGYVPTRVRSLELLLFAKES
jgi:hypothetical protein